MKIDTADHLRDASPWRAEPDPVKLAILGKFAEELGELTAAVARCIIQGVDGVHPVTGKPNIDWLFEEMVDVDNMGNFIHEKIFDRNGDRSEELGDAFTHRFFKKRAHIKQWLASFKTP